MDAIPAKYLKNMGTYPNINIHGVTVIVYTVSSPTLIDNHISDFHSHTVTNKVEVVVLDIVRKLSKTGNSQQIGSLLVLYASNRCLIVHLDNISMHPLLANFCKTLKDSNICCVGTAEGITCTGSLAVKAGELAAMVLKKPGLIDSTLADLAREIGVRYDGTSTGTRTEITVDLRIPTVLSEEMVKIAIRDAVACYQVGCKLLQLTTINGNSHVKNDDSG
ncbi:hypothetical protein BVRB_4g079490 [Beta vulgaris subsp. vulgaris]|nr:hypothetical protein BVRB_4g079490 [Beta vulgaris subsp. vulgaris]